MCRGTQTETDTKATNDEKRSNEELQDKRRRKRTHKTTTKKQQGHEEARKGSTGGKRPEIDTNGKNKTVTIEVSKGSTYRGKAGEKDCCNREKIDHKLAKKHAGGEKIYCKGTNLQKTR